MHFLFPCIYAICVFFWVTCKYENTHPYCFRIWFSKNTEVYFCILFVNIAWFDFECFSSEFDFSILYGLSGLIKVTRLTIKVDWGLAECLSMHLFAGKKSDPYDHWSMLVHLIRCIDFWGSGVFDFVFPEIDVTCYYPWSPAYPGWYSFYYHSWGVWRRLVWHITIVSVYRARC